ncbi:MAG: CYTH domain-containing protein [Xenococcaceae cyanobacterium MO_188.B19]|nr:CYTH domain-containing protein [Xenococcaceae cyanobacterium MO_188.B19]
MGKEIERKYLVKNNDWKSLAPGVVYRQGYIATVGKQTVRVRIVGNQGYLTIKGENIGATRSEFEYPIPVKDAAEMLDTLCDHPLIEKTRYKIPIGDLIWEIDEFTGENKGLIIAEVELQSENQVIELPPWIDRQVRDPKYYNSSLAKYPYSQWKPDNNY